MKYNANGYLRAFTLILIIFAGAVSLADNNGALIPTFTLLFDGSCPENAELSDNGIDDDCDGLVDEAPQPCDSGLILNESDPVKAAAAIDVCTIGSETEWGLLDASFKRANGSSISPSVQHGLISSFGDNTPARSGDRMLYLSTGTARMDGQTNACNSESCAGFGLGTPPAGFPQDVPACSGGTTIYDDIALEINLRAPANATGFEFSFLFSSFEFPEWVCTTFNDQFIVQMTPAPQGSISGNIVFDSFTNPVSVNIGFFDHCDAASLGSYPGSLTPPNPYCPYGASIMDGTGFNEWSSDYAGSTGWLRTSAPVTPGSEFTLRFLIWDTGDQAYDSAVVIDNFRWLGGDNSVGTQP